MRPGLMACLALGLLVSGCGKKAIAPPPPAPAEPAPPPPPPPPPPPAAEPVSIDLGDVFFDFDKSDLRSDARATLTENGKQLMQSTSTRITIEGHCDERGTVDYNLALGERRAMAAKSFLVSYGVSGDRIETISYGENRPFALGHDEASWAQNRRAHFVITSR